jgi:hypothetical protein
MVNGMTGGHDMLRCNGYMDTKTCWYVDIYIRCCIAWACGYGVYVFVLHTTELFNYTVI